MKKKKTKKKKKLYIIKNYILKIIKKILKIKITELN